MHPEIRAALSVPYVVSALRRSGMTEAEAIVLVDYYLEKGWEVIAYEPEQILGLWRRGIKRPGPKGDPSNYVDYHARGDWQRRLSLTDYETRRDWHMSNRWFGYIETNTVSINHLETTEIAFANLDKLSSGFVNYEGITSEFRLNQPTTPDSEARWAEFRTWLSERERRLSAR